MLTENAQPLHAFVVIALQELKTEVAFGGDVGQLIAGGVKLVEGIAEQLWASSRASISGSRASSAGLWENSGYGPLMGAIVKARRRIATAVVGPPLSAVQPSGAGAAMSPGSQMRALTANRARPNSTTIAAGNRVERRNCTGLPDGLPF